jgi:hypothetical protein
MFTFLASKVLGPLECYAQPDGTFSMVLSPSNRCYEGEWNENYGSVILYTFMYLALIPLLIIIAFFRNRKNRNDRVFFLRYGSLMQPYKAQFYFWELIWTTKKALFVALVKVLAGVSLSNRLFYLICVLIIFIGVENYFLPFKTNYLNGLNISWNIVAIFLLLANAFIFEPASVGSVGKVLTAISVIVLLLLVLIVSVSRIVRNCITRKRNVEQKKEIIIQDDDDVWLGQTGAFSTDAAATFSVNPLQAETLSLAPTNRMSVFPSVIELPEQTRASVANVRSRLSLI